MKGGSGAGGVLHEEYLANLPGDVLFLAPGSVTPESFPNAFSAVTGKFDQHPVDAIQDWWLVNTEQGRAVGQAFQPDAGVGQAFQPDSAEQNGDVSSGARQAGKPDLRLVDAQGNPFVLADDANTLVVGAATWCGATQKFVAALRDPEVAAQLEGLRIVFAFDDEGGDGPGGVLDAAFLENLPGEVAFLARGSVRPERLPSAYNPDSGQFDRSAVEMVNLWLGNGTLAGGMCGNKNVGLGARGWGLGEEGGTGSASGSDASQNTGTASGTPALLSPVSSPSSSPSPQSPAPSPSADGGSGGGGCSVTGDYNGDCVVNAADYVVFRDTLGATGMDLPADGNGDLAVTPADYEVWTGNFGEELALPGAFSITGPAHAVSNDDILVEWTASAGADGYELKLSDNADCSAPFHVENLTTTSKAFNGLGDRTLYICVSAVNLSGATAASNQPYQVVIQTADVSQLIFVTNIEYFLEEVPSFPPATPYIHGVGAADYECTRLASAAGLLTQPWDGTSIIFKAMITVDLVDLIDRVGVSAGPFVNVNGDQIAETRAELYSGTFTAPILNQHGQPISGANIPVWTGSTVSGTWSGSTCSNWHDPYSSIATVGNLNGTGSQWLSNATQPCYLGARFYCAKVN